MDIALTEPVMDTEVFANFAAEVGHESTAGIFNVFITDTERRLKMMRQLSCDSDRDTIENEAHAMKGAAATFGFRQMCVMAEALERDTPTVTDEAYLEYLGHLDAAFRVARQRYADNIVMAA